LNEAGGGKIFLAHTKSQYHWIKQFLTYRCSGPIELRSNIELIFDSSIRLFFEFNPENYFKGDKGVITRYEGTTIYGYSPCIRAFNVSNVALTYRHGEGGMPVIDGDGMKWQKWYTEGNQMLRTQGKNPPVDQIRKMNNAGIPVVERRAKKPEEWFLRPELIQFFLSENVLIDGIKMKDSPFWVIHPVFSRNLTFRNISFDAEVINNDGFDPESSQNILIENIMFSNRDDNVAIKAGRDLEGREGADISGTGLESIESVYINDNKMGGPSKNIVVRNCIFKGHNALAIGSEMSGGVRNVFVLDNQSVHEVYNGIYLKSSRMRGGVIENVYVKNMDLNNVLINAVSLIPNYQTKTDGTHPPLFKNIYIENLTANITKNGIVVTGWLDRPIEDITIKNVNLKKVYEEHITIKQAENIELTNVSMEDTLYNDVYTVIDSTFQPPAVN
jgi:polygalacturonase